MSLEESKQVWFLLVKSKLMITVHDVEAFFTIIRITLNGDDALVRRGKDGLHVHRVLGHTV